MGTKLIFTFNSHIKLKITGQINYLENIFEQKAYDRQKNAFLYKTF